MQFVNQRILAIVPLFSFTYVLVPMCFNTFLTRVPEFHIGLLRTSTRLYLGSSIAIPGRFFRSSRCDSYSAFLNAHAFVCKRIPVNFLLLAIHFKIRRSLAECITAL